MDADPDEREIICIVSDDYRAFAAPLRLLAIARVCKEGGARVATSGTRAVIECVQPLLGSSRYELCYDCLVMPRQHLVSSVLPCSVRDLQLPRGGTQLAAGTQLPPLQNGLSNGKMHSEGGRSLSVSGPGQREGQSCV